MISSNDAHAWVEVLFDKAGWVQFDPTPLGGGQGGQQGFTETRGGSADHRGHRECAGSRAGLQPDDDDRPTAAATGAAPAPVRRPPAPPTNAPIVPAWMWWALAGLLLAAAAAAGPTVVAGDGAADAAATGRRGWTGRGGWRPGGRSRTWPSTTESA